MRMTLRLVLCIFLALTLEGCRGDSFKERLSGFWNRLRGKSDDTEEPAPLTSNSTMKLAAVNQCTGKNMGMYVWSQNVWRPGTEGAQRDLLNFFSSPQGREWACGDVYINIADHTNPERIHNNTYIVPFLTKLRAASQNYKSVIWLTYGDLTGEPEAGNRIVQFVNTFFGWLGALKQSEKASVGRIGLSFDVEHIEPEFTKQALLNSQSSRGKLLGFSPGQILIQHTIEGRPNTVGTDYVMRYADSALLMIYRNYMVDPTGKYHEDSNMYNRMRWFLTEQCPRCLDDAFAKANYKAVITQMVEASCQTGEYCGKISFCAQGDAQYMLDTAQQMNRALIDKKLLTVAQYNRLFNATTRLSVHDWAWFRCFSPFKAFNDKCVNFPASVSACKAQR